MGNNSNLVVVEPLKETRYNAPDLNKYVYLSDVAYGQKVYIFDIFVDVLSNGRVSVASTAPVDFNTDSMMNRYGRVFGVEKIRTGRFLKRTRVRLYPPHLDWLADPELKINLRTRPRQFNYMVTELVYDGESS